jgi:photosystem II stability/assembly factor-like uncharacterized protein
VNTIDGGKTCSFQADTLMDARCMQSMRNGWILGTDIVSKMQIARTTDGGTTWTSAQIPDPEWHLGASPFFDELRSDAVCFSSMLKPDMRRLRSGTELPALC